LVPVIRIYNDAGQQNFKLDNNITASTSLRL